MDEKILVTGSNGQLASEIKRKAENSPKLSFVFTDSSQLDIRDHEKLRTFLKENKITTIINCAAYTAVDKAEIEQEKANEINHIAVKNMAELAKENNIRFIHFSTDYVFDGKGKCPYQTNTLTNPINSYGKSKLEGEKAILSVNPKNSVIIRTSWVYSAFGNNFVKTILRIGKEKKEISIVNDQLGSPTYAADLAAFTLDNLVHFQADGTKVFHFANQGICSWYDFAKEIVVLAKLDCKVNPIPSTSYPTPAERPQYSCLDTTETKSHFGIEIPTWEESLKKCIQKILAQ